MSMGAYETSLPDGTRSQGAAHGGSLLKLSTENAACCVSNACPGLPRRMPRDETGRRAGCRKSARPGKNFRNYKNSFCESRMDSSPRWCRHVDDEIFDYSPSRLFVKCEIMAARGPRTRFQDCGFSGLVAVPTVKSHPAMLMVQSTQNRAADDIPGPLKPRGNGTSLFRDK